MRGIPLLDLLIFSFLVITAIRGYHRGMIKQTVGLVAFVAALLLAATYYQDIAQLLTLNQSISRAIPQEIANLISFSLLVLLVILTINLIGYLLHTLSQVFFLSLLDNIGGAFVGIMKGAFLLFLVLLVLTELPIPFFTNQLNGSFFARDLLSLVPYFKEHFFSIFQP